MARLRKNRERPPQTIRVAVTLPTHELLLMNKLEKDEALYKILERLLTRYQELEIINADLKESLKESRIKRAQLESELELIRVRV